ncbi:hypothetical protein J4E08_19190 [Sagittula sp. NFXS13]|uniref:MotE family protein n=1 Tax=Sagittula sp. NFXS13 TaxID=2819095 RepID=UPI0032DF4708
MKLFKKQADVQAPKAKSVRKSRKKPKGTLAAIGALLLASALVRVGVGAGEAMAKADADAESHAPEVREEQHAAQGSAASTVSDAEIVPLIAALKAREARVSKREEDMNVRMQALSVAEQEIERKMQALEDAEKRLRDTLALARTAAEDDLTQLTDVYANMKPKQAAALFQEMDPQFAAGFLSRMRPNSAAAIMAGMDPQKAYLISVILAGRNANVPKE